MKSKIEQNSFRRGIMSLILLSLLQRSDMYGYQLVQEIKAGKVEYRLDKTNIIHCPIGKVSFGTEKLQQNMDTLVAAVVKAKPAAAKGQYIRSCTVASTMGPGVKVNTSKYI